MTLSTFYVTSTWKDQQGTNVELVQLVEGVGYQDVENGSFAKPTIVLFQGYDDSALQLGQWSTTNWF